MAAIDYKEVSRAATGLWDAILPAMGIELRKLNKNGPCILCGGNDRAHFFERQGRIMNYCRHGCGNSGDGNCVSSPEHLLMEVNRWTFPEMVNAVADFLNVTPQEQLAQYRVVAATKVAAKLVYPSDHKENPEQAKLLLAKCKSEETHMHLLRNNTAPQDTLKTLKGSLIVDLYNQAGELVNLAAIQADGSVKYSAEGISYGAVATLEPVGEHDGAVILTMDYAEAWRLWWARKGLSRVICSLGHENCKWISDKQRERFTHIGCTQEFAEDFQDYGHEVILIAGPYADKVA